MTAALPWHAQPFALLDDPRATGDDGQPPSRLYTGWVREHVCINPAALEAMWAAVAQDQQAGLHAVLLADYEWGDALVGRMARDRAPDTHTPLDTPRDTADEPALRVLMFAHLQRLAPDQVTALLQAADEGQQAPGVAGVLGLRPSVSPTEFHHAIARIHQAIADGETYQVNFTYRLHGQAHGQPAALYRRLRQRQPAPYAAWIALPPVGPAQGCARHGEALAGLRHVLSLSPELFLQVEPGLITARPMKGTAVRLGDAARDAHTAQALAQDPKNRAENLMIVDLLRNDLGRLAEVGSVRVPQLFEVEHHGGVLQMTSTVQARPRPEVGWPALLRATFPCGSITGAPKRQTMAWIRALETTPRGLYCGAIGWLEPPLPADEGHLGRACLSVAIRTVTLEPPQPNGLRALTMGVGAGMVQDSVADDEARECQLKARFLTGMDPGFELFETLRLENGQYPWLSRHLARLAASAERCGFAHSGDAAQALLAAEAQATGGQGGWRVRLALRHDGHLSLSRAPLEPLPLGPDGQPAPVRLLLAPEPLPAQRPLATLKTSQRAHYDAAVRAATAQGAFDSLLFSPEGWLLEGGRSNVLARLDGRWCTPRVADGVLPGVMRSVLMDDPHWALQERRLHRDECGQVQAWAVCNALRGVVAVSQVLGLTGDMTP